MASGDKKGLTLPALREEELRVWISPDTGKASGTEESGHDNVSWQTQQELSNFV